MKLLTFQPFSLYSNGGGNRILRRLFKGREAQVTSLVVSEAEVGPHDGPIVETVVYASPIIRKWARWKLRDWFTWLRRNTFKKATIRKIQKAATNINYDVLHVVDHGPYAAALCSDGFVNSKPLWVSFHDHFATTYSTGEVSGLLWKTASRRLVISDELATEYQRLFGKLDYELITDGVIGEEVSSVKASLPEPMVIYFAGLLHLAYIPLFKVLADALDLLAAQGKQFKLVLRGTQRIPFLEGRSFETEYHGISLNDAELKRELDASTILYLPIKFSVPEFYLYSLSTKMVGYLGASGAILYHGPDDSAACGLLKGFEAALCNTQLDAEALSNDIVELINNRETVSANAKTLAKSRFDMCGIQKRFWENSNG